MPAAASASSESNPTSGQEEQRAAAIDGLRLELLRRGGTCTGRLSSGSMSPTIDAGDEVFVAPMRAPRPGLVVLFLREGRMTVHRLLGRAPGDGRWLEMGDGNPRGETIGEKDLLGQVIEVRKSAGTLLLAGRRARVAGRAIAALQRLALRLGSGGDERPALVRRIALRFVRRAADVLIRGASRPREGA